MILVHRSVDVRTFRPQHDYGNNDYLHYSDCVLAARAAAGRGPDLATAATTTVSYRNIPRAVGTAAAAVPPKPDPSGTAASSAGARSPASRSGAQGFAAAPTRAVLACVPGHPATAASASAAHPGPAEQRAAAATSTEISSINSTTRSVRASTTTPRTGATTAGRGDSPAVSTTVWEAVELGRGWLVQDG